MSYRLELGLAVLLTTAIGVALWAASRASKVPEEDFRASTFLSGPRGSKGVYLVLNRLGRPAERRRTSLFTLNDSTGVRHPPTVLAVIAPQYGLQDAELDEVAEFIEHGGAVVSAGAGGGITRCVGWKAPWSGEAFRRDSLVVRRPPELAGVRLPRATRVLERWTASESERRDGRIQELVKGEDAEACAGLVPLRVDTIIAAADRRPVILRFRYRGGGSMTLAADPGWFTNEVWRNTDVAALLLPLLTHPAPPERPGRVAWDEYHQGFGEARMGLAGQTWRWLRASPTGWAILQLIAVALLWLALSAVRFGPARAVIERRRRSPVEHLEALGAGLESASDSDTAVQRLAFGLRRRLSRTGNLSSGDLRGWLDSLELAMRGPEGRAAVRRLRQIITQRSSARDGQRVLAAAQAVEDVWEELRPRKTREAF